MTTSAGGKAGPRGGQGWFVRSLGTAERDAEACRLRAHGLTYQQKADHMGYSHRDLARRAVGQALAATMQEPADEPRL